MGNLLNNFVFMPPENDYYDRQSFNNDCITLKTSHGSYIFAKEINDLSSEIFIIFSHGNAETIEDAYNWCRYFFNNKIKANIIVYEYTGYYNNKYNYHIQFNDTNTSCHNDNNNIESDQTITTFLPSEMYTYNDIEAVYNYLIKHRNADSKNIIAIGRSLGSGPSCYLAEKYNIGALVLTSSFSSILRIAFNLRFTLFFDMFPNINRVKNIDCPTLIVHSVKDELVPFYNALDLYINSKNPVNPLFVNGTFHNDLDKSCLEYFDRINNLIEIVKKNNNNKILN